MILLFLLFQNLYQKSHQLNLHTQSISDKTENNITVNRDSNDTEEIKIRIDKNIKKLKKFDEKRTNKTQFINKRNNNNINNLSINKISKIEHIKIDSDISKKKVDAFTRNRIELKILFKNDIKKDESNDLKINDKNKNELIFKKKKV